MAGAYKRKKTAKRWTAWYYDADGKRCWKAGYTDKAATERLAMKLEDEARQVRDGLIERRAVDARGHAKATIAEHAEAYRLYLASKGNTADHCSQTAGAIIRLFEACGASKLNGLRLERVQHELAALKAAKSARTSNHARGAIKAFLRWSKASGRLADTPEWLPMLKPQNEKLDRKKIRRELTHDESRRLIEAAEAGPPCKLRPTRVESAEYRANLRELVKDRMLALIADGVYPSIVALRREVVAAADSIRVAQRSLIESGDVVIPPEMLQDLHKPAKPRAPDRPPADARRRILSGPDRAMLYRTILGTGFRRDEAASLVPGDFDLDGKVIRCRASYTKNKQEAAQPISSDLAERLRPWLEGRPAGQPVWRLPEDTGEMLQRDLAAAGVEHVTAEGVIDLHSLRHTYISRLIAAGIDPKTVQILARHSTITLTIDRYSHTTDDRKRAAIEGLGSTPAADIAAKDQEPKEGDGSG